MKDKVFNYYVTSANFNGKGRGFAVGFDSRKAAYAFATFVLFGFAEVMPWHEFENHFPNYKKS
ncbi:MAG: hypothetical protein IKW46_11170 [Bacteroidaceae bacterium]|nr:hypothetical protein [Bacteroidaceae bacterium]